MRTDSARLLATLLLTAAVSCCANQATASSDIDIGEKAGAVIGDIADVTRDFRLTDLPGNLEIEADEMAFDYEAGRLSYRGKVKVVHGEVTMRADKLELIFHPGRAKSLDQIEAIGNVEVLRGEERATGDQATYDPDRRIITLTGKATLGSGTSSIGVESVVVHLSERRAEIKSKNVRTGETGDRVRAVIDPDSLDILDDPKRK
jgi:lipopolysaccharide transport protein LptA